MLPNSCLLPEVQELRVQSCHLWSNWTAFHSKPPGFTHPSLFLYPLCLLDSFLSALCSSFSPLLYPISYLSISLLSVPLCVPIALSPSLYLALICWYGSGCIIQKDTCSLFIIEPKKGGGV